MVEPRTKFTVADYMCTADEVRYQLLDGDLILAPSPTDRHQNLVGSIYFLLRQFAEQASARRIRIAPLDVVLGDNDVTQPDVLFVSNERSEIISEANIQGAPDLVVEVLSPLTEGNDRGYKRDLYGRFGVKEYWLVDPATETIEVLSSSGETLVSFAVFHRTETLLSPLLPELKIDLIPVFGE